jgi:hypothetical protein
LLKLKAKVLTGFIEPNQVALEVKPVRKTSDMAEPTEAQRSRRLIGLIGA